MSRLLARSLTGALLIGVIVLARALLGRKLPRRAFVCLWGVAALHLLLPRLPVWSMSIWSLWRRLPSMGQAMPGAVSGPAVSGVPAAGLPLQVDAVELAAGQGTLFQVWLWGAAVLAGFFLLAYLRGRLRFAGAAPAEVPGVEDWRQARAIRRIIRVRQSL